MTALIVLVLLAAVVLTSWQCGYQEGRAAQLEDELRAADRLRRADPFRNVRPIREPRRGA